MIDAARKAILIAALTLTSCSSQVIPAATPTTNTTPLRIYTTPATLPLMNNLVAEYTATYPDQTFNIRVAGYLSLQQQTLTEPDVYFLTNHLPADSLLWAAPIGQDGLSVIVHPDITTQTLTSQQIRNIYQGYTTNWDNLGGGALPIQVVSRESGSSSRQEFERLLIGNRPLLPTTRIAPSNDAMRQIVSNTPGSIGYVTLGQLDTRVRTIAVDGIYPTPENLINNTYPLRSTLFIVGAKEPNTGYREFIGWVQSSAGQSVVRASYSRLFVP